MQHCPPVSWHFVISAQCDVKGWRTDVPIFIYKHFQPLTITTCQPFQCSCFRFRMLFFILTLTQGFTSLLLGRICLWCCKRVSVGMEKNPYSQPSQLVEHLVQQKSKSCWCWLWQQTPEWEQNANLPIKPPRVRWLIPAEGGSSCVTLVPMRWIDCDSHPNLQAIWWSFVRYRVITGRSMIYGQTNTLVNVMLGKLSCFKTLHVALECPWVHRACKKTSQLSALLDLCLFCDGRWLLMFLIKIQAAAEVSLDQDEFRDLLVLTIIPSRFPLSSQLWPAVVFLRLSWLIFFIFFSFYFILDYFGFSPASHSFSPVSDELLPPVYLSPSCTCRSAHSRRVCERMYVDVLFSHSS